MKDGIVKFVLLNNYFKNSEYSLKNILFCLNGNEKILVLCSEDLKKELLELKSETFIPKLSDIKDYLDIRDIKYDDKDIMD